jgi:16S rRNA (cytosine1402-N4)-methyltransferase
MSRHITVLLKEVIEGLNLKPGMNAVDCTLGDAGHAEAILMATESRGMLLGIDADVEAILRSKQYLYGFGDRFIVARDNFANLKQIIEKNKFFPVQAILMDLGWSSPQFEERGRGFSFLKDEVLDMRYGSECQTKTAADILNSSSVEELAKIFHLYGEEKNSYAIAKAIVEAIKKKPIEKTGDLVPIIKALKHKNIKTIHPATKVFQALRIAVNNELEVLRQALPQAVEVLASGGRLAVISFHSLEDRIVKQYFRSIENTLVKVVTKKPVVPSREEIRKNPRSRSAKMRVVEKL